MKALSLLIIAIAAATLSHAAEETRPVKVFTMKDGSTVIAVRSMAMSADGKTSYTVTDASGKKLSFDDTQVQEVVDDVVPAKSLPSAVTAATGSDNAQAAKIYDEYLKQNNLVPPSAVGAAQGQQGSMTGVPRASNVEPYTGPNLGLQPDSADIHTRRNSGWRWIGDGAYWGSYGGVTYILDRNGLRRVGCHNTVVAGTGASANQGYANPYAPAMAGSSFRPNNAVNSPVGAVAFNSTGSKSASVTPSAPASTPIASRSSGISTGNSGYNGCPINQSPARTLPAFAPTNAFNAIPTRTNSVAASPRSGGTVSSGGGGGSSSASGGGYRAPSGGSGNLNTGGRARR